MKPSSTFSVLVLILANAISLQSADACSCLPPSIEQSFESSSDVLVGEVIQKRHINHQIRYSVRVSESYKGCTESSSLVVLTTPESSATCGLTTLRVGQQYLINGVREESASGHPTLAVHACGYNIAASHLSVEEESYLISNAESCELEVCTDFSEIEVGPCDFPLGIGVLDGECQSIHGCELPHGVETFESIAACEATCL